jgi:chorismate mutase
LKKLYALRGAAQSLNSAEDIKRQTAVLYDELLEKNGLEEKDIVCVFFSVTDDLTAVNPATALRMAGRAANLSLFVLKEAEFDGSPERTIRVMIQCYLEEDSVICHVYRNGAQTLRPDLTGLGGKP